MSVETRKGRRVGPLEYLVLHDTNLSRGSLGQVRPDDQWALGDRPNTKLRAALSIVQYAVSDLQHVEVVESTRASKAGDRNNLVDNS